MRNYDLITPEGTKDLLFGEAIARRKASNRRYVTVWLVSIVCHQPSASVGECVRTK